MTRILASLAAVAVLAGPAAAFAQAAAAPATSPKPPRRAAAAIPGIAPVGDLAGTPKAAGQYNTFLKAMEANGLTPVLQSAGPLTVIAPTDAAFDALPAGQLDTLMKPENSTQLRAILLAHVINAAVTPDKVKGSTTVAIPDVGGGKLTFDGTTPALKVDGAAVIALGTASNGDIYGIDGKLARGLILQQLPALEAQVGRTLWSADFCAAAKADPPTRIKPDLMSRRS